METKWLGKASHVTFNQRAVLGRLCKVQRLGQCGYKA